MHGIRHIGKAHPGVSDISGESVCGIRLIGKPPTVGSDISGTRYSLSAASPCYTAARNWGSKSDQNSRGMRGFPIRDDFFGLGRTGQGVHKARQIFGVGEIGTELEAQTLQ